MNPEDENNTDVSLEDGIKIFMQMLPVLQKLTAAGAADPAATTAADNDDEGLEGTQDNDNPEEGTADNDDDQEGTQDNDDDSGTADGDDGDDKTAAALDAMDKELKALKRNGFKNVIREVARRDQLVKRLSPVVGTFDAADMTTAEVAKYGVKKLGINAPKGQEMAYLDGYLNGVAKAAPKATVLSGTGLDAADANSPISKYLTGSNK